MCIMVKIKRNLKEDLLPPGVNILYTRVNGYKFKIQIHEHKTCK